MYRKLLSLLLVLSGVAYAQVPISGLPPATTPLTGNEVIIVNQNKATKQTAVSNLLPLAPPLSAAYLLQTPNPLLPGSRTLVGTANEILLADGGPLGSLVLSTPQPIGIISSPTFAGLALTGALSGTSASFSGSLTAASLALTTPLPATSGGTGFGSYAIGDLLSASTTTALSKVSDVAAGSYLRSGGVGTLPLWSTVKIPNAAALGDLWYGSAASTISSLAGNITATKQFLTQTGTGTVSAAPIWGTIAAADLPGSFSGFANPSGLVGLTAVNGVATTADRSDSTHALDQSIAPSWTGLHTFTKATTMTPTTGTALTITGLATAPTVAITAPSTGTDYLSLTSSTTSFIGLSETVSGGHTFAMRASGAGFSIADVTNGTNPISFTNTGSVSIPAPSSGTPLTITGIGPSLQELINSGNGTNGSGDLQITRGSSTGNTIATGPNIQLQDNSGIFATTLQNSGGQTELWQFNGSWGQVLKIGTAHNLVLNAPTSGTPDVLSTNTNGIAQIGISINGAVGGQAALGFYANNSSASASFIGTAGAANQITAGSAIGDLVIRTFNQNIDFTTNHGVSTNVLQLLSTGAILMPSLAASSAAQTGTVCWTTGGNLTVDTTVACLASAARYKKNISNLDVGLSEIMRLRPVSYDLRDDPYQLGRQVGLIAEEVGAVDPRLMGLTGDKKQAQGVRYMQLTAVLVKAVQQQQHEIEVLAAVIAALITWNTFLTIRIRRL